MAAWYESTTQKMAVKEYKSRADMERDANKAAEFGWQIVSQSEQSQRSGCLRLLTLGIFTLFWKPKSRILVTYSHP